MADLHIGLLLPLSVMQVPGHLGSKVFVTISESARDEMVLSLIGM